MSLLGGKILSVTTDGFVTTLINCLKALKQARKDALRKEGESMFLFMFSEFESLRVSLDLSGEGLEMKKRGRGIVN